MNGFDNLDQNQRQRAASTTHTVSSMTRDDIDRHVARAHRLRAEQLRSWGRRVAGSWASVFRRPGHLLPRDSRARDQLAHSHQA